MHSRRYTEETREKSLRNPCYSRSINQHKKRDGPGKNEASLFVFYVRSHTRTHTRARLHAARKALESNVEV